MEREGVIDKLEELQMHKNHLVYERTVKMLETYFQDDAEMDLMDVINNSGAPDEKNTFNF